MVIIDICFFFIRENEWRSIKRLNHSLKKMKFGREHFHDSLSNFFFWFISSILFLHTYTHKKSSQTSLSFRFGYRTIWHRHLPFNHSQYGYYSCHLPSFFISYSYGIVLQPRTHNFFFLLLHHKRIYKQAFAKKRNNPKKE